MAALAAGVSTDSTEVVLDGAVWSRMSEDIISKEILPRTTLEFVRVSKAYKTLAYKHIARDPRIGHTHPTKSVRRQMLQCIGGDNLEAMEILCNLTAAPSREDYFELLVFACVSRRTRFIRTIEATYLRVGIIETPYPVAGRDHGVERGRQLCMEHGIALAEIELLECMRNVDSKAFYAQIHAWSLRPSGEGGKGGALFKYVYTHLKLVDKCRFLQEIFKQYSDKSDAVVAFLKETDYVLRLNAFDCVLREYYLKCDKRSAKGFAMRWGNVFNPYRHQLLVIASVAKSKLKSPNWLEHAEAWFLLTRTIIKSDVDFRHVYRRDFETKNFDFICGVLDHIIAANTIGVEDSTIDIEGRI
jgi:hypothetical protein